MSIPVFYVPLLNPRQRKANLPGQVAVFPTGIAPELSSGENGLAATTVSEKVQLAEETVRKALPLGPQEAKATLREMLRMGEEFAAGGLLKELAAHQVLKARDEQWTGRPGEFADLARFAATGEHEDQESITMGEWSRASAEAAAASAASVRQALVDCQKILLLAQSLEERRHELARLEERYSALERSLMESLGEGALDELPDELEGGHDVAEEGGSSLSWRVIVDAALPFLPENAALFTDDESMASDLRESGMLQPFPEDRAALCRGWDPGLVAGLLFVNLPAWRLVGRKGPTPERPWLDRDVELFVARPARGWAGLNNAKGCDA